MNDRVLVRTRFDPCADESVAVVVAESLSLVVESPIDLPPLAHTIDTDSLDSLFTPDVDTPPPGELRLTFPYERWQVTITGAGEIIICARPGYELLSD